MSLLTSSGGSATGLLGKQSAPSNLGYDAKIILVPTGTEIATKNEALTESTWLDLINSAIGSRAIALPIFYELESSPEEDVYATSSLGAVSFVREGKDTVKYSVQVTPVVMSQLRTLNGVKWQAYVITSEGFIKGTTPDNVKFLPFTIDNLRVGKEVKATGSEPATLPISVTFGKPEEWSSFPAFVEPLRDGLPDVWNPRDLRDPKAILSTVSNATTSGFDIVLEGYDKVSFEGAVIADILIKDKSTGSLITASSVTENTPGHYSVAATIPAGTYLIGMAQVGTAGATQGYAGLERDLVEVVIS